MAEKDVRAWLAVPTGFRAGILLSVGLDAVSLRVLDLPVQLRLVLAAGKFLGGMEHLSCNHQSAAYV